MNGDQTKLESIRRRGIYVPGHPDDSRFHDLLYKTRKKEALVTLGKQKVYRVYPHTLGYSAWLSRTVTRARGLARAQAITGKKAPRLEYL